MYYIKDEDSFMPLMRGLYHFRMTEVLKLKNLADHIISNNEATSQLYAQLNNILKI